MRKSTFIIKAIVFLFLFNNVPDVRSQDFASTPLRLCWQIEKNEETNIFIASDNDYGIFTAFSGGLLESINKNNGQTIWRSEIGGEILSSFIFDNENLYILSRNLRLEAGENDSKAENGNVIFQALSKETGVTKWRQPLFLRASEKLSLIDGINKLFLLTDTGRFFAFNKENGEIKFEKDLNVDPNTIPFLAENRIYFGTTNKKVIGISSITGDIETEYSLARLPTAIFGSSGKEIYIGDDLGDFITLDLDTGKIRWQALTGAQIASVKKAGNGLLVSSYDNYVYFFSEKNGKRLWRKRLSGRSVGDPLVKNKIAVFSTINGNDTVFIELKKGKSINRIIIPDENYFLNNPISAEGLIVFQTYKGILAFGSENDCKQK